MCRTMIVQPLVGGGVMLTPPCEVVESSKNLFDVPPVVKTSGRVVGSTAKTISWPLYIAPGVPSHVPLSGNENCVVSGAARSPFSSATSRTFSGTHSATEPIWTASVSVSWEPLSVAAVMAIVSDPSIHVMGDWL